MLDFISNGGGGFGDALEREPESVLEEVIDGFMTVDKARRMYGVVIDVVDPDIHDLRIDRAATEKLRANLERRELPTGYGPGEMHPDGLRTGELLAHPGRNH